MLLLLHHVKLGRIHYSESTNIKHQVCVISSKAYLQSSIIHYYVAVGAWEVFYEHIKLE